MTTAYRNTFSLPKTAIVTDMACILIVLHFTDLNLSDDGVVVVVLGLQDEALRQAAVVAPRAPDLQYNILVVEPSGRQGKPSGWTKSISPRTRV